MSKISLTRTVTLVPEMVRACLANTEEEYGLRGMWDQVDINTEVDPRVKYILMEVYIEPRFSQFHNVTATCTGDFIDARIDPELTIELEVADHRNGRPWDDPRWKFRCRLRNWIKIEVEKIK